MINLTLTLTFENTEELQRMVNRIHASKMPYVCDSKLGLIKDIRDMFRAYQGTGREPGLIDLKQMVEKHLTSVE